MIFSHSSLFTCILLAAGAGNRFGSKTPKQFCELEKNFTVLEKSFETVSKFSEKVILVLPSHQGGIHPVVQRVLQESEKINCKIQICQGGNTRQQSVENALLVAESEYVFIHDAARCFVNENDVRQLLEKVLLCKAAILAAKVTDTIKKVNSNFEIENTLDRRFLWAAQTPQAFQTALLKSAFLQASQTNFIGTDDASVVENFGNPVQIIEAKYANPKITYENDLEIFQSLLKRNF